MPTSRAVLESGFQRAGFPVYETTSPGREYILSSGHHARIMEASGPAPVRLSYENANGQPISPFTGKPPPNPPKNLDRQERLDYTRNKTHVELGP